MTETDDESVCTEDIVEPEPNAPEPESTPEPEPEVKPKRGRANKSSKVAEPEPTPEPEPEEAAPEPESTPELEPEEAAPKKRGRGRPKGSCSKNRSDSTLAQQLTKAELIQMVQKQHELLQAHKARDIENEKFVTETMAKKKERKLAKDKKPRTPAQIAATERMIAARKAKRKAELSETGKEIADSIDKSLADKVEECVTNIVMKPLRALTPERVKKVEALKEPKKPSKFVWSGADAFFK
jgi:hypothetical protein